MRFQKSQDWLHFSESSEFNAKQRVSTTGVRLFLSATGVRLFPQLSSALVALLRRNGAAGHVDDLLYRIQCA